MCNLIFYCFIIFFQPSPSRPSVSSSKRSNRVRAIKEKAFNIVATPSRGRRHRQGCKEETSTTEDSSPTKTPARQRRKTTGRDTPAQSKRAVETSASESSPAPSSTKTSKTKDVFVRGRPCMHSLSQQGIWASFGHPNP